MKKHYENRGDSPVYFTGSRRTYSRCIWRDNETGKEYVRWYGEYVEVERGLVGGYYNTVEK